MVYRIGVTELNPAHDTVGKHALVATYHHASGFRLRAGNVLHRYWNKRALQGGHEYVDDLCYPRGWAGAARSAGPVRGVPQVPGPVRGVPESTGAEEWPICGDIPFPALDPWRSVVDLVHCGPWRAACMVAWGSGVVKRHRLGPLHVMIPGSRAGTGQGCVFLRRKFAVLVAKVNCIFCRG